MENFTAIIGAKIRDFQNKMKKVDRQVRETAMEATKPINADINEFYTQMALADAQAKQVLKRGTKEIDADASDFMRKAAEVAVVSRSLSQRIIVPIELQINKFQAKISRIASMTRAFGELMQTTMQGIGMSLAPALVPLIATLGGLLGQLGPMLGTIAGSAFALGSAFGVAGIAAGAFTGLMVSNLKEVFKATDDVAKIQEKLADETDNKKRAELLTKIKNIQGGLTAEQMKAYDAMGKLSATWDKLSNSLQTPVIKIFTDFLGIMGDMVRRLTPMFQGSVKAVDTLTSSLGKAFKGESMMAFFKYLNTSAGPMLVTMGKAVGNFIQGILNMVTAFSGLTADTSKGFLEMSESFAAWTAGLGESKKFQAFVDYVKENMPKIRSIFSDAFQGIINIFAGFAPSSSDMMTSLQDMMERFKEWSSTIDANQGFQKFIDYIKENGPQVVSLIANVVESVVNIGKALAPMGAKILELVNSFISWTNELMKNHPILGKIGAAVLVITGLLIAIAPNIIAFGTLFGGAATGIMTATSLMRAKFVTGMAMMVTSMVKTATAMVVNTAKMVAQWVVMGTKSMIQAAKVAAAWVLATGKAMATGLASMVTASAKFVAKWVLMGAQALIHAAKVAAGWALATGKAMASAIASMVVAAAKMVARWVFMGAQALIQAGRMAAAWFIALGPVGWVIAAVIGLAILIIANWDKIKAKTIEIWKKVADAVKDAWEKVKEKTAEAIVKVVKFISEMAGKILKFRADMLSAGKDLIQGLIDGVVGMGKKALKSVTDLGGNIISAAKGIFGIKSPSRVFSEIGYYIGTGLAIGVSNTQKANEKVMNDLGKVMINVTKANAAAVAKIAAVAEKERTAVQKASAAKEKEIERKAAEDIHQIISDAKAKKRKLTVTESLRIEQIRRDSSAKIRKNEVSHNEQLNAINKKAWAEMVKREAEVNKERYDAVQKFVDNKLKLEGLSAIQEANIWRKAADSFKKGTQEKIDAETKYRDTLRKIQADVEATNEKYSQRMIDINKNLADEIEKVNADLVANSKAAKDKLIEDEKRLNDVYKNTLEDRYNTLRNFAGLFDKFDMSPKETGTDLLDNLQSQVDGFKSWESEITKLSAKGVNDGLLEELRDMGPKALPQLLALNSMTSDQLTKYSSLFTEKSALARAEAEEQLIGMKADTQKQIQALRAATSVELMMLNAEARQRIVELRTVAKEELATLQVDWINDITSITKATAEEFKTLTQIGKDAVAGLITGMKSMKGPLQAEAKAIADSVQKTIKSALQIHSPSRVLEKLGEYAGMGLVGGLSSSIGKVMAISKELALAATPVLAGVQMAPMDTQSQMDSLHRQIKQELSVDMDVNHKGTVGNGGASQAPILYVTIDAKNVKEINDVVRLFDQQNWDSE